MRSFRDFIDGKERQALRHLRIVKDVLETQGFKVEDHTNNPFSDRYIYVFNPFQNTSFEGIRMYCLGDSIVYRVQRESETHPYGTAYSLDVEMMFDDLVEDGTPHEKIGEKMAKVTANEIRAFFKESERAEKDDEKNDDDSLGQVYVRNPLGGDYANTVKDKM